MASQKQRLSTTRMRILDAAQHLFVKEGYAATTMQLIMNQAQVSKGGMYHHFDSKEDIFGAIFTQISKDSIAQAITLSTKGNTAIEQIYNSALAWLMVVREPQVATILLEQGPTVLGWKKAREIEELHSLANLIKAFQHAQQLKEVNIQSATTVAKMFNALLAESAFIEIAEGKSSYHDVEQVIKLFLNGLATITSDYEGNKLK